MKLTQEQIDRFNAFQASKHVHPLTCADRTHSDGEDVLVATRDGITCPTCGWRQPDNHPTVRMILNADGLG
jgi:hypothetical protein